jgi:hypothetical protein
MICEINANSPPEVLTSCSVAVHTVRGFTAFSLGLAKNGGLHIQKSNLHHITTSTPQHNTTQHIRDKREKGREEERYCSSD